VITGQALLLTPACYPRHVRRGEPRTGCGIPATVIGLVACCGLAVDVVDNPVAVCCSSGCPDGVAISGVPGSGGRPPRPPGVNELARRPPRAAQGMVSSPGAFRKFTETCSVGGSISPPTMLILPLAAMILLLSTMNTDSAKMLPPLPVPPATDVVTVLLCKSKSRPALSVTLPTLAEAVRVRISALSSTTPRSFIELSVESDRAALSGTIGC
jgi:hypothetical protein